MIKTVLFDLDGTLLPMDQDVFTKAYFKRLAKRAAPLGYEPNALIDGVWAGMASMVKNDGSRTNERAFWETFAQIFGEKVYRDIPVFDDFYRNEFNEARSSCGFNERAGETIRMLQEGGKRLVLASNPVFPLPAQENRLRWAGVDPNVFCYLTSYENSHYCKPNPAYYTEILQTLGLCAEECLMVGNDAREDGAALKAGISVFLLTDCLLHADAFGIESVPHGGYPELQAYLRGNVL